jgi:hypothetical protein
MTTFKITYVTTGNRKLDYVCISTSDYLNNGKKVSNIVDAIKSFEEIAETWGTFENKNAIVKIEVL